MFSRVGSPTCLFLFEQKNTAALETAQLLTLATPFSSVFITQINPFLSIYSLSCTVHTAFSASLCVSWHLDSSFSSFLSLEIPPILPAQLSYRNSFKKSFNLIISQSIANQLHCFGRAARQNTGNGTMGQALSNLMAGRQQRELGRGWGIRNMFQAVSQ